MTKYISILILTLSINIASFGQTNNDSKLLNIDTLKITIIKFDSSIFYIFKDYKAAELTNNEIVKIDKILKQAIAEDHNKKKKYKSQIIGDLSIYYRQYVATTNKKGEKEVWINCLCRTEGVNWKKELVLYLGGGNCYFNLKINLNTDKYYDLFINGPM